MASPAPSGDPAMALLLPSVAVGFRGAGAGRDPQLEGQRRMSSGSQSASPAAQPYAGGASPFAGTGPARSAAGPSCPSVPSLLIRVHRAQHQSGGVLNRLLGGGSGNGNMMIRIASGSLSASFPVDRKGLANATAPNLALPQGYEGSGSGGGADGGSLRVELVGQGGKLADGFISISTLFTLGQEGAGGDSMEPMSGHEGGSATEVPLFTPPDAKGIRMRAGTVELSVRWHEEPPFRPPMEAPPPAFLQQPMLAQSKPQMPLQPPGAGGGYSFVMDDRPPQLSRMMEPPVPRGAVPGRGQMASGPSGSGSKQGNLLRVNTNTAMDCMLTAALKVRLQ